MTLKSPGDSEGGLPAHARFAGRHGPAVLFLLVAAGLLASCATVPKNDVPQGFAGVVIPGTETAAGAGAPPRHTSKAERAEKTPQRTSKPKKAGTPRRATAPRKTTVTLAQGERSLFETIRSVGKSFGGNLVAMRGIGQKIVPPLSLHKTPYRRYAEALARGTGVMLHRAGPYYFLYPDERYAPLLDLSLAGQLPPRYDEMRLSLALGDGTRLFNALAMISNSLGVSLVADNAVADARCGEMVLTDVSLRVCLEALLQSARIQPGGITVHRGTSYVFFAMRGRTRPDTYLIGPEPAPGTPLAEAFVRETHLAMPRRVPRGAAMPVYEGAVSLGGVLNALSSQLGFPVEARGDAAQLPVNPFVLHGVSAREALDLLVGQWLTDEYGYSVEGAGVVIHAVQPTG